MLEDLPARDHQPSSGENSIYQLSAHRDYCTPPFEKILCAPLHAAPSGQEDIGPSSYRERTRLSWKRRYNITVRRQALSCRRARMPGQYQKHRYDKSVSDWRQPIKLSCYTLPQVPCSMRSVPQ
jgi:hypothetical protein